MWLFFDWFLQSILYQCFMQFLQFTQSVCFTHCGALFEGKKQMSPAILVTIAVDPCLFAEWQYERR